MQASSREFGFFVATPVAASNSTAGNQTAIGGYTFTYDAENRLKTSTLGGNTTTYAYDGEGRRVKKGNEIYGPHRDSLRACRNNPVSPTGLGAGLGGGFGVQISFVGLRRAVFAWGLVRSDKV
jgi:YD repeat-containing protein